MDMTCRCPGWRPTGTSRDRARSRALARRAWIWHGARLARRRARTLERRQQPDVDLPPRRRLAHGVRLARPPRRLPGVTRRQAARDLRARRRAPALARA